MFITLKMLYLFIKTTKSKEGEREKDSAVALRSFDGLRVLRGVWVELVAGDFDFVV